MSLYMDRAIFGHVHGKGQKLPYPCPWIGQMGLSMLNIIDVKAKVNNNLEIVRWSCQFDLQVKL
jgi:hypothetical protein